MDQKSGDPLTNWVAVFFYRNGFHKGIDCLLISHDGVSINTGVEQLDLHVELVLMVKK
jgi:hypothetical protein